MTPANYFAQLQELVKEEQQHENLSRNAFLSRTQLSPYSIIQESNCRYPVTVGSLNGGSHGNLFAVSFEVEDFEGDLEFEAGGAVNFFYPGEDGSVMEVNGSFQIYSVDKHGLTLMAPSMSVAISVQALGAKHPMGVQSAIDNYSYDMMLQALSQAKNKTEKRFLHLRNVLLGLEKPEFRDLPSVSCPWLNISQTMAIQKAMEANDVAIIHGPPGTGKTTTLAEAIVETIRKEPQVLVCAPSNTAVDWISDILSRRGIPVLRIGNPTRISHEMLDCSYERRFGAHPLAPALWSVKSSIQELHKKPSGERNHNQLHKLVSQEQELEIRINQEIFDKARVITCTLVGAQHHLLNNRHFGTVFIDEAAQALTPACWCAIVKADKVVLSGDHMQLPPVVKSPKAVKGGLAHTLMQQISRLHPECVTLLNVQYRMHKDIMEFPSRMFYHSRLVAADQVANATLSPIDYPLTWVDTSRMNFQEKVNSRTQSKLNAEEARMLVHVLRDYINFLGIARVQDKGITFGIISPYKAQVKIIRRLLKMQRFFKAIKKQIAVNSVDGFQGQERDVILLSMVRDNDEGSIGFLRDLRRINVAITRAKMKLIVVGNTETLSKHKFYSQLISHIEDRGEFIQPIPQPLEMEQGGAEKPQQDISENNDVKR